MGVEGTLGILANEAFKLDKLRSESPIVLPSVSVMTYLVADLPDVDPADWPEVLAANGVWKMTVAWPWVSEAWGTEVEEATGAGPGVGGGGINVIMNCCCYRWEKSCCCCNCCCLSSSCFFSLSRSCLWMSSVPAAWTP